MGECVAARARWSRRRAAFVGFTLLLTTCSTTHAQVARGDFLDREGVRHSAGEAYQLRFGPSAGEPHYVRAALEDLALLGFGTIWYLARPDANSVDWDVDTVDGKLNPTQIRFDNNRFTTNTLLHPIAGSGYYGLARANGVSIPGALGYAFAASTIWEYALEWREKVSLNDMILTPWGGMVLGECFVKLLDYVSSGPPQGPPARQAARYVLGFPHRIHAALDGTAPVDDHMPTDSLGFSSAYAHDIRLGYELARGVDDQERGGTQHVVIAQSEIIVLPGFLHPGQFHQTFAHGNFTEMSLRLGYTSRGLVDADIWMRAAFLGYYGQDMGRAIPGELRGHAYALSLISAFTNTQRRFLDYRDQSGILHAAGPAIDVWLTTAGVWFRGRIEGSVDFAALHAAAFDRFRARHPDGTIKGVLDKYGYDYYVGASLRAHAIATYRVLELGQRVSYGTYRSVAGIDRFQEEISRSANSTDQILSYRAWLGVHLAWFQLQVRMEQRVRTGAFEGEHSGRWERLAGLGLQLRF